MKYNFDDTSLIIGHLKEVLHNFNLPAVPVYKDSEDPIEDRTYIKDNKVVKYTDGKFKDLAFYTYNKPIVNLTRNLLINSSKYDLYTHMYFGDYLRFIRDYNGIDLMSMYNCFGGESPNRMEYSLDIDSTNETMSYNYKIDIPVLDSEGKQIYDSESNPIMEEVKGRYITETHEEEISVLDSGGEQVYDSEGNPVVEIITVTERVFKTLEELGLSPNYKETTGSSTLRFTIDTGSPDYNFYVVPVKFNQVYTVAIDSEVKYELACVLYNDIFITNTPDQLVQESYRCLSGSRFNTPYIYDTHFSCVNDLWAKEKDLRLVLKLPKNINSSIVILEGNYTPCSNVLDGSFITKIEYNDDSDVYYSKNSLLSLNDGHNYPFADRLVEYILDNVITPKDKISGNIERVQDKVYKDRSIEGYYGIWDKELRKNIHKLTLNPDITKGTSKKYGNTLCELLKDSEGNYVYDSEGNLVWTPISEELEPKRFIDIYDDVTCYVDKDVETLLRLL